MPKFQVIDQSVFEKRSKESVGRHAYLAEYKEYIGQIEIGFGGELHLEDGDKKATIKNRVMHACRELNKQVRFVRTDAEHVKFQIIGVLDPNKVVEDEDGEDEAVPA